MDINIDESAFEKLIVGDNPLIRPKSEDDNINTDDIKIEDIMPDSKPKPVPVKENMIKKIIDLESATVINLDKKKRKKQLRRRNIEELKTILAGGLEQGVSMLASAEAREIIKDSQEQQQQEDDDIQDKKREAPEIDKDMAVSVLFKFNVLCAELIEEASVRAQQKYPEYIPTNLKGWGKDLRTENATELRYAIKRVVDEYFEELKPLMSPFALLLLVNMFSAKNAAIANLKKSSAEQPVPP